VKKPAGLFLIGWLEPDQMRNLKRIRSLLLVCVSAILLAACSATSTPVQGLVAVTVAVDGKQVNVQAPAGSSVQSALDSASVTLSSLDRVDPPSYSLITGPTHIKVTRVTEAFEIENQVIPFSQQKVKNESLPEGKTLLIQPGVNGEMQITYRKVSEDGVEVSRSPVKNQVITDPKPEIIMVGVQSPFAAIPITHRLAYLTGGNAWVMQRSTGERKLVVSTSDLDGHIFSLSSDGKWLLFTRKSTKSATELINTLWVVNTLDDNPVPINLNVNNVVLFADFVPGAVTTIMYSTVEPRSAPPGWQSNNDLQQLTFAATGTIIRQEEIIPTNQGGIYGWWGTTYAWSSDGKSLAYARPDGVGLVDLEKKKLTPVLDILPYQPQGDWAWVPGINWSPDHQVLFTGTHAGKSGLSSAEASPIFDLSAILVSNSQAINMISQAGMFAYPSTSPMQPGNRFYIAYLQAIFPDRSDSSRYHLTLTQRDGSNHKVVFPPDGSPGLEPQQVVWSPLPSDGSPEWIAVHYQGNLWFIDPVSGQTQQITGDGLISRIDWK
jgi:hypothetical protein